MDHSDEMSLDYQALAHKILAEKQPICDFIREQKRNDTPNLPQLMDALKDQLFKIVMEQEAQRRKKFDSAIQKQELVVEKLTHLFNKSKERLDKLKHQQKAISRQRENLHNQLKRKDDRTSVLVQNMQRIDKDRKGCLGKINSPMWQSPHHFHMTSIEHHMGNSQPQLFDVAQLIRGHLGLCAVARRTTLFQNQLRSYVEKAKVEREQVVERLNRCSRMLAVIDAEIEDSTKMHGAISLEMSREGHVKFRRAQYHNVHASAHPSGTRSIPSSPIVYRNSPHGNSTCYRQIKQHYFQSLNISPTSFSLPLGHSVVSPSSSANESAFSSSSIELKTDEDGIPEIGQPNCLSEWNEMKVVLEELREASHIRQIMWEQLELILDCRERLKQEFQTA